jgi:large subunit ribosomal protein L29
MKASEAHNLKDDELVERIRQTRDEQFALRLQHATGELENTSRITAARKDVARLLTLAKERGIDLEQELKV